MFTKVPTTGKFHKQTEVIWCRPDEKHLSLLPYLNRKSVLRWELLLILLVFIKVQKGNKVQHISMENLSTLPRKKGVKKLPLDKLLLEDLGLPFSTIQTIHPESPFLEDEFKPCRGWCWRNFWWLRKSTMLEAYVGINRPTPLLRFMTFVHSCTFAVLCSVSDLFVVSLEFMNGTSCCVIIIRRNFKQSWAARPSYSRYLEVIGVHDFLCYRHVALQNLTPLWFAMC